MTAGLQDSYARMLLQSPETHRLSERGQIHQLDRFLSEPEVYAVFKASDIVWLGYRNHYLPSGVMVQAGQMGLPVIACNEGLIGWTTEASQSGVVVDIDDPEDVCRGMMKLVEDPGLAAEYGRNGKVRFSGHTHKHFGDAIGGSL